MEEAFAIVRDKPEMEMLFWGIPNTPGVSIIAGKAKSGKTIFVENLVYALVNPNQSEFMGMDIPTLERIAIVSFEEILENRSRRELKQITKYDPDNELEIPKKVAVLNDTPFILLNTDEDYVELINHLKEEKS